MSLSCPQTPIVSDFKQVNWLAKKGSSETGRRVFQRKASEKWRKPKKQLMNKLETSYKSYAAQWRDVTVEIRLNLLLERCRGEAFDMRLCEIFCCAN